MNLYWSDTRANGKPLEPGWLCMVSDPEDGTNPIYFYGKTEEEVMRKIGFNNLHAQATIQRLMSGKAAPGSAPASSAAPQLPARMTADEVMQATQDLQNPARAGEATARLVADATGVDLNRLALETYGRIAQEWEEETPEFYHHEGNIKLLTDAVKVMVGGRLGLVTKQMLTQKFHELTARGLLFTAPEGQQPTTAPTNPNPFPGESPVQRVTVRPRGATRFATSARSSNFGAPQTAPRKTLKYTENEIREMPYEKATMLTESNDPDYAAACEYYFSEQPA